jgi:hypothetical protein
MIVVPAVIPAAMARTVATRGTGRPARMAPGSSAITDHVPPTSPVTTAAPAHVRVVMVRTDAIKGTARLVRVALAPTDKMAPVLPIALETTAAPALVLRPIVGLGRTSARDHRVAVAPVLLPARIRLVGG